jgi:uroporphyrin-III C-methyltransferase
MIAEAKLGNIVARVKGGDPFVFGRGGEEMLALRAAGLDYEVVPGVTAGIGVPAALDVPVTHRGLAHSVTLVTGHLREDAEPDWRSLARAGTTLIIYMGIARMRHIIAELLAGGMSPNTSAAAVQQGTLPQEKRVITRLAQLAEDAEHTGIASPALLVIGEVVSLARKAALEVAQRDAA